jgi:hypothetical protein
MIAFIGFLRTRLTWTGVRTWHGHGQGQEHGNACRLEQGHGHITDIAMDMDIRHGHKGRA